MTPLARLGQLSRRVYRRVARIPSMRDPLLHLEDAAATAAFHLHAGRRAALRRELAGCSSVDEIYAFATRAFGPHQFKSEIVALLQRLAQDKPRHVCEIGTADGGTNCLLVHALPTVEFMLGIDLFVKGKQRLRHFATRGQELHYLDGSSYAPATVERARAILAGRQLDVLFIDGDHTYEGVRQDFLRYRQFVRDGGAIVFHDICPDFQTRYGRQTGHWAGDVPRFWERLRPLYPHEEFIQDPGQDGLGIGLIRYSPSVTLPEGL